MKATTRQKKILRFFKVPFSPRISVGAAGWEISALMESEANRERWRRYLYLTKDFDIDSEQLIPFDEKILNELIIPEDWSASTELKKFRSELVANKLLNCSLFDNPQPIVEFEKRSFIFTGKFAFGSRRACQAAVIERGGISPSQKSISH